MFYGIIENPESKYQLGQPVWSNKVYADYMDWKNGKEYWKLMEAAFMEKLVNGAAPQMMLGKAGLQPLLDGKVAEEDSKDARWVKFEAGYHEFVAVSYTHLDVYKRQILFWLRMYSNTISGMPPLRPPSTSLPLISSQVKSGISSRATRKLPARWVSWAKLTT